MQARWGTHGDSSVIALCPATVQDCFDLTVEAFNMSERFRTPVILLGDEIVGHMRERVQIPEPGEVNIYPRRLPDDTAEYLPYLPAADGVPALAPIGGDKIVHATSSMHDETGRTNNDPENARKVISRLWDKIEGYSEEIELSRSFGDPDAEVLVVCYGATSRAAWAAIDGAARKGVRLRVLQLLTIWPFASTLIERETRERKVAVVPEMNLGQLIREVKNHSMCEVVGLNKSNGEPIEPEEIIVRVMEVAR